EYSDTAEGWAACLVHNPPEEDYLRYHGPGWFSIAFGEHVARVSGICRWSGFATIDDRQRIHAEGFRSIARALGGTRMVLIPEYDPADEIALYDGGSLDDCLELLRQRWGAPHPRTEVVTPDLEEYYRRKFPVWYVESINQNG